MRVLIAGLVSAYGLGDLLQYYLASKLLRKYLPRSEIYLAVSDNEFAEKFSGLREENVTLLPSLLELASLSRLFLSATKIRKYAVPSEVSFTNGRRRLATTIFESYHRSRLASILRATIIRKVFNERFHATVIGGHTIERSSFFDYINTYIVQRSISNISITCPISASMLGLSQHTSRIQILKKALNNIDIIFVRGKHSLSVLTSLVNPKKVVTTADVGFASRLFFQLPTKKDAARIIVIPRKDYFIFYNKLDLYTRYLYELLHVVCRLAEEGYEITLYPHTLRNPNDTRMISDEDAINDLLNMINLKYTPRVTQRITISAPKNLEEDWRNLSSSMMVLTSRMHAGIMALSAGVPVIFMQPRDDIKMLDVLSTLGVDEQEFFVDIFGSGGFSGRINE